MTVPPIEQFTNNFFISTPLFSGGENFQLQPYHTTFGLLVAKAGEEQYITVDNQPITEFVTPWGPMPKSDEGGADLVGAVIRLQHGTRLVRNTERKNFQLLVYGYADRESYGFPAAMDFKVLPN